MQNPIYTIHNVYYKVHDYLYLEPYSQTVISISKFTGIFT